MATTKVLHVCTFSWLSVARQTARSGRTTYPAHHGFHGSHSSSLCKSLVRRIDFVAVGHRTAPRRLEKLLKVRETLNEGLPEAEKLSLNDMLLKAAALASKKVPDVRNRTPHHGPVVVAFFFFFWYLSVFFFFGTKEQFFFLVAVLAARCNPISSFDCSVVVGSRVAYYT